MTTLARCGLVLGAILAVTGNAATTVAGVVVETEPNDSKLLANVVALPAASTLAVIGGTSNATTGAGLDYFRLTTAAQSVPGFFRHRLIIQSAIPGHTATIRGLNQVGGVPGLVDSTLQSSSVATTPARFVQWYTSQDPASLYVRVTGTATTTADYVLDYEVAPVAEIAGPVGITPGTITITTVGHTSTDTDLWVYDATRTALVGFGNDDEFGTTALQSKLDRDYAAGTYYLAISNFNLANDLGSPPDDDFVTGVVLDFPEALANSSTTVNLPLNTAIAGNTVPATKFDPYEIVFIRFVVGAQVTFLRGDSNVDGLYNIADPILTLAVLFGGGGIVPQCRDACDANDDELLNIADPIYVLADQFSGGPSPPTPFFGCGTDPAGAALDCASDPACP